MASQYRTSSTKRIYTNPLAYDSASSALYQKTMNPMGVQPQAAPQQAQSQSPFTIDANSVDYTKLTAGLIGSIELPTYEPMDSGSFAGGYEDYLSATDGENKGITPDGKKLASETSSSARAATAAQRKIVDVTKSYIGQNRYVYGKFDCSKFTQEVAGKSGEKIPRTAATQFNYFKTKRRLVGQDDARAGDVIFMRSSASPSGWHVGIYVGNGQMIDNAGRGKRIAVRGIKGRKILGFGRMNIKYTAPKATSSSGRVGTSNYVY